MKMTAKETMDDDETIDALAAARALLGEDDEIVDEEQVEMLPGVRPIAAAPKTLDPDPPRRPTKKTGGKKNPFQNLIGAGERLLVSKRDQLNGQLAYIGQYSPEDLMRSGSVEVFLREYIVPTYDFGEFQLSLLSTDGNQRPMGSVKIAGPANEKKGENSIKELFELQQAMDKKAKEESDSSMKNTLQMMALMKSFMPQPKEASGGGGSDMMPMMMMMMMMNQQKPSGPDPMMQFMMMKMMKEEREDVAPPSFHMPPMLPQQSSPVDNVSELATLINALKPAQTSTSVQDLASIAQMFRPQDNDRLTIKDLIALAPTIKDVLGGGASKTGSFAETVQNLGQLQQLLSGMQGNNSEGGFMELAQSIIENAPALAAAITAGKGDKAEVKAPSSAEMVSASTKREARKVPVIIDGFKEFADKMVEASNVGEPDDVGDEGQLIEQCLRGLLFLRKGSGEWKPYVEGFMTFVKDNNKEKSMKVLEVFLKTFMDRDFITDSCANSTYQAFDDNWDQVRTSLGFKKKDEKLAKNGKDKDVAVEVVKTETVAEAEDSDVDDEEDGEEDDEVEDDDDDNEIEMTDAQIAAIASEVIDEDSSPNPPAA
jgi:hypothetical protein